MSVARQFRGTLGELAGEAGDIILLVLGLIIFFAVLAPILGIFNAVRGIIPGAGSFGQPATMQKVGTVGDVVNVGRHRRWWRERWEGKEAEIKMRGTVGAVLNVRGQSAPWQGIGVTVPGPTTGYPYPYTASYNPYPTFYRQEAFFMGQGLIAPQTYVRGPRIIGRGAQ